MFFFGWPCITLLTLSSHSNEGIQKTVSLSVSPTDLPTGGYNHKRKNQALLSNSREVTTRHPFSRRHSYSGSKSNGPTDIIKVATIFSIL